MAFGLTPIAAQHVNFGLYADSGLTITPDIADKPLDFGTRLSGESVSILHTDDEAVAFIIEGAAYLDVTVSIYPPEFLLLEGDFDNFNDPSKRIQVDNIGMAYYNSVQNHQDIDIETARQGAITVVGNSVTFQISRRPGGPPGPPPVPPHAGYTPPPGAAVIFVYGSITIGNVNAGPYSDFIDIHVEYSTYQ